MLMKKKMNRFEVIKKIAKGGFGSVCKVRKLTGSDKGTIYALKEIKLKNAATAFNELKVM